MKSKQNKENGTLEATIMNKFNITHMVQKQFSSEMIHFEVIHKWPLQKRYILLLIVITYSKKAHEGFYATFYFSSQLLHTILIILSRQ